MTILAGCEAAAIQSALDQYRAAAVRMHPTVRGVVESGLSEFGEMLPLDQAAEEGCPRVETRLSLYLSADDLLAGLWDASALWDDESGPAIEEMTSDLIRWHILASLMMAGGPGSPKAASLAAEARACGHRGEPEVQRFLDAGCRAIERAFGIRVPRA